MFEITWFIVPSLCATLMFMLDKSFYGNMIYCVGYPLLIWHNIQIGDNSQISYFSILLVMTIIGVCRHVWRNKKRLTKSV